MAQQSSGNGTLIVTTVVVAVIAFGGGYFVGNKTTKMGGDDPLPGAASAPTFGEVASANSKSTIVDSDVIPVGNSPMLGNPNALVTVVEFSDYQCPFCDRGAKTVKELQEKYPEDVRVVFKNYPLPFHKEAPAASKAALAAGEQGKYWEMHDKLFENFKQFKANASDMKGYTAGLAGELGLDVEKFKADFDKPEFAKMIEDDKKLGGKLGVRGTPHFFINGVRLSGAQPLAKFEEVFIAQRDAAKKIGGTSFYRDLVKKNFKAAEPPKARKPAGSTVQMVPVDKKDAMKNAGGDYLVTVVEFSDYQCPFCKRGDDTLQEIIKNYGDEVRVVFKHLPLPFHKQAEIASRAALAAGQQGKFWEYHALLFENQKAIKEGEPALMKWAEELGLNMDKFKKDYNDPAIIKQVKDDAALAGRVGARGTPNFFVNGIQVTGAQPFSSFKPQIDKQIALAKKTAKEKNLKGDALYKELVAINKKNAPKAPAKPAAPPEKVDVKLLTKGNSYAKGPDSAKVKIYEFSDFQCPFCSRGANTIDEVVKKYGDKVQVVFKANPLPFHKQAEPAHRAAVAAGQQGKFWEMHDLLFKNQKALKTDDIDNLLAGYAGELGLNVDKFKAAYSSPEVAKQVKDEMAQGTKVQVRGTPHFFVNGTRLVGAQPLAKFEAAIDAAMK